MAAGVRARDPGWDTGMSCGLRVGNAGWWERGSESSLLPPVGAGASWGAPSDQVWAWPLLWVVGWPQLVPPGRELAGVTHRARPTRTQPLVPRALVTAAEGWGATGCV